MAKLVLFIVSMCVVWHLMHTQITSHIPFNVFFKGSDRTHYVCINYKGRVGNNLFQFAMMYAISMEKNLSIASPISELLLDTFDIKALNYYPFFSNLFCNGFRKKNDSLHCAFDRDMVSTIIGEDVYFDGYFQSWKYWKNYEKELRSMIKFKNHLLDRAYLLLQTILVTHNVIKNTIQEVTLIGVHIRRGDMLTQHIQTFGYNVATEHYLHNAIDHFNKRFSKTFFIVCSDEIDWAKYVLSIYKNIHFMENSSWETDMAILSLTNHTIITVGSFGWWAAWLNGGTTVYYKYPYRQDSELSKMFHPSMSDYFYPGWIGLE